MIALIIVVCSLKAGVPTCESFPGRSINADTHRAHVDNRPHWGPRYV